MREPRYTPETVLEQAKQDLSTWAAQYRLQLGRVSDEERAGMVEGAIAATALEHTPHHRADLFELARHFSETHFHLATEPLPDYPIPAIGLIAACLNEWLKLRLATYWDHQIEPDRAGSYRSLPDHYFLVEETGVGWKEVDVETADPYALLLKLADRLGREDEYGSNRTYRIVYTAPEERPLLEVKLERGAAYYSAEDGAETLYHVWAKNWNHNAGRFFGLARTLLVAEFLRATREFASEVAQASGYVRHPLIVDEALRPVREVWTVTVTVGPRIGLDGSDAAEE